MRICLLHGQCTPPTEFTHKRPLTAQSRGLAIEEYSNIGRRDWANRADQRKAQFTELLLELDNVERLLKHAWRALKRAYHASAYSRQSFLK